MTNTPRLCSTAAKVRQEWKKAPSVGMNDILRAEAEEAILQHYDMTYQTGVGGERQPARC